MDEINTNKLSQRLQAVSEYIPLGASLADIGSDHAYLPCYVVKQGTVPYAVAGEVVEGPFQAACRQVREDRLESKISVRKGNGLEVIGLEDQIDTVTIAGMGGALITTILEDGKAKLVNTKRLILQPNISAITIRKWLIENNWELIAEKILEEDGKIYEILVAEKGNPLQPYADLPTELLVGPFLCREYSTVFRKKWQSEIRNWQRIVNQLEHAAQTEDNVKRKEELVGNIKRVQEVLHRESSKRA